MTTSYSVYGRNHRFIVILVSFDVLNGRCYPCFPNRVINLNQRIPFCSEEGVEGYFRWFEARRCTGGVMCREEVADLLNYCLSIVTCHLTFERHSPHGVFREMVDQELLGVLE